MTKSQDEKKNQNLKKWGEKRGGGEKKKESTVNAYIDIKAFHTHWNNHKSYKIMYILITTWQSEKYKYCQDNWKTQK